VLNYRLCSQFLPPTVRLHLTLDLNHGFTVCALGCAPRIIKHSRRHCKQRQIPTSSAISVEMAEFTPSPTSPAWADFTSVYSIPDYLDPATCTFEKCGFNYSYWSYRPRKSTNLAFAVLFGISALAFLAQGIASKKRWLGFTIAMVLGCVTEVVGYVSRVKAYDDLHSEVNASPERLDVS
jgi:hypothetical protein